MPEGGEVVSAEEVEAEGEEVVGVKTGIEDSAFEPEFEPEEAVGAELVVGIVTESAKLVLEETAPT